MERDVLIGTVVDLDRSAGSPKNPHVQNSDSSRNAGDAPPAFSGRRLALASLPALLLAACGSGRAPDVSEESGAPRRDSVAVSEPPCRDHAWDLLTTGYSSACARGGSGTRCWGVWSTFAPDGAWNGAYVQVPEANSFLNLNGATQITAAASGWFHTCAAAATGVWCWGDNTQYELGNGTSTASGAPVRVAADFGDHVAALSSKALTTCAVLDDGEVFCWGLNLGDAQTQSLTTPTSLDLGGRQARQVAVGGDFGCVVSTEGEILCWGNNDSGQVGVPGAPTSALPRLVDTGGKRARFIALSLESACAVFEGETSACWGHNDYGQLGTGDNDKRFAPTPVALGTSAGAPVAMDGGSRHLCATYADGSLQCWGKNTCWELSGVDDPGLTGGQLGLGEPDSSMQRTPRAVPLAGRKVTSVRLGVDNTCASFDDGNVKCWGCNFVPMENGEIGDQSGLTPAQITANSTPSRRNPLTLGDAGLCPQNPCASVDDGDPCTVDTCDPVNGITHVVAADGTSCCAAPDACSTEASRAPGSAVCVYPVLPDMQPCDDGDPDTSGETCHAGMCIPVATPDATPHVAPFNAGITPWDLKGHVMITEKALHILAKRNLLPPLLNDPVNRALLVYGNNFADSPSAGWPDPGLFGSAPRLPIVNRMTAHLPQTPLAEKTASFHFDADHPLIDPTITTTATATVAWVPGKPADTAQPDASNLSDSLRFVVSLKVETNAHGSTILDPLKCFVSLHPVPDLGLDCSSVQPDDRTLPLTFAMDNMYHYGLGDLAEIASDVTPAIGTSMRLTPFEARDVPDYDKDSTHMDAAIKQADRLRNQELLAGADYGVTKYGAILYQLSRRFFTGSYVPEPDFAQLIKVGNDVPGWHTGRMQGHGELSALAFEFPHTYLGGMPFVCANSDSADPCANGTPTWPAWIRDTPPCCADAAACSAFRTDPAASACPDLAALEVARPGRSDRAGLIYLGWATHMIQDASLPHHVANWTGPQHQDQDSLGDLPLYYPDLDSAGSYERHCTAGACYSVWVPSPGFGYVADPQYLVDTALAADLDEWLGPIGAPRDRSEICRSLGINDTDAPPDDLRWQVVHPLFRAQARRAYDARQEYLPRTASGAPSDAMLMAGRDYVANAVLGTIKLLLCATPGAAPITAEPSSPPAVTPPASCGVLRAGEGLHLSQSLKSCNGSYAIALGSNRALTLYQDFAVLAIGWQPIGFFSPAEPAASELVMQADGNLVVYDSLGVALWSTNTQNHPGAVLRLDDDGTLELRQGSSSLRLLHAGL
jgi:alpha-tubulin suppressor-like RCC1 family protein